METVKPRIAVIDYGMSNLRSVLKAWEHMGADVRLITRPEDTGEAQALVFPGQGAIVDTMKLLQSTGFDRLIRDWIAADRPFFGICLGLQALFEHSEEGDTPCLGIFPGQVKRFRFSPELGLKVPHMGWNSVTFTKETPLNAGLASGKDQFYFVHSYHVQSADPSINWCETTYGIPYASGIASGNCFATQFHPEKSQAKGLQMYENFIRHVANLDT